MTYPIHMGRSLAVATVIALVGSAATAKPMFRPPPPPRADPVELAARLEDAIRHHDTAAVQLLLGDAVVHDGVWFPDAACATKFGKQGRVEKAEVRTLAKCLAQLKPIATTRRSSISSGAILTFDPGFEIELAFVNDRVAYIASQWPRDADRGLPTLTVQAFEALRKSGTTQLDAALAGKLGSPASAWIKVCLDKTGAVTSTYVAEARPPSTSAQFVAAIADWTFRPFELHKKPMAACALSLLSYPSSSAPAIEILPPTPTVSLPPSSGSINDEIDILDFTGTSINAAPQTVPPTVLETSRLKGTKQIDPDAVTKTEITKAGHTNVIASLKMCLDDKGKVSQVRQLKSSGFPAYDAKLTREMLKWTYKPFLVRGAPAAVCTAYTFIYRPKP